MADKQDELQPIIVKKIKKGGHGHHGGAWKVAYADFVTAMMAFFLLLWLLASTSEQTKDGISEYFTSVPMVTRSESGSGGVMGGLTVSPDGAMTSTVAPLVERKQTTEPAMKAGSENPSLEGDVSDDRYEAERKSREIENFEAAKNALENAIAAAPELNDMADSFQIDMTDEGLRIQIAEKENRPLFTSGSAELAQHTKDILRKVSGVIQKLPNEISVRGHTDSVPFGSGAKYTNWELSAERANAARRQLINSGLPAPRVNNVVGKADTDHLLPDDPTNGRNRRISVILLHDRVTTKEGANKSSRAVKRDEKVKNELYQKTDGAVEFP